jgi:hypothetical protein
LVDGRLAGSTCRSDLIMAERSEENADGIFG